MTRRRPPRTVARALALMVGDLVMEADRYLAACLDTRPLMAHACDTAAWLGRSWRRCYAAAHRTQFGPGRGVFAVVINRRRPEERS